MAQSIKFTASGSSNAIGNFAPGDVAKVSYEMARHFVEEAMCAQYLTAATVEAQVEEPVKRTRKTKAKES